MNEFKIEYLTHMSCELRILKHTFWYVIW